MKHEKRIVSTPLEVRAGDDGKAPTIVGHAAVFGQATTIGNAFREQIAPGTFARAIAEDQDVRALFNHDSNVVLGRTKAGTLRMAEDELGLRVEIDPPDTQAGRDLIESITRGDIDQMSFGFVVRSESWDDQDEELPMRTLRDVDLFDVSPVTFPAYDGTDVAVRDATDCAAALVTIERMKAKRAEELYHAELDREAQLRHWKLGK